MINAKLVTCCLCQNYYSDPRQIPCSHSFCFDCISGRFNEETCLVICPKCDKTHQYQSIDEFQQRCMRDGFLSSMVAQYKKTQSRLTSRPSSTISHLSSPIPSQTIQETNSNQTTPKTPLIAKCQSCNIRTELNVCQHCDNVICSKCANEHSNSRSKNMKIQWEICRNRFENINEQSIRYEHDQTEVNKRTKHLQKLINKHSEQLIQAIEDRKTQYIHLIEKHRHDYKPSFVHEQVIDEYESIDKRLADLLKSTDISPNKISDFLFEIGHLEKRLDHFNKHFDTNQLKFPQLTLPSKTDLTTLFGTLEYADLHGNCSTQIDPYLSTMKINGESDIEISLDDNQCIHLDSISSNEQKKKLLWQIDYFSVPYYVRTYNNQLFVCDKYGSLAIYKLNGQLKPNLIREIRLFKDAVVPSPINDDDQTIIDSFTIYKLWIIVFKRKKNELHGTIYLFTHDGKLIPNGKFLHNYPSRELTVDTECDLLWSLDQKQLALFYYDLPDIKPVNPDEYFQTRHSHVQFSKPFAPIHISANKHSLAVLDKNRQSIHVYDKRTRCELYEYINTSYTFTHFCWDMALFSDNNLLIKLDDMNTLKTGPSKHIYLQIDAKRQYAISGSIEETDAYGMMITANDEILIGVRINTKGIIKCYV